MPLRATESEEYQIILSEPPSIIGDPLGFEPQQNSKWCWAACVEMMLKHRQISPLDKQCKIAENGFKVKEKDFTCCDEHGCFNNNPDCIDTMIDGEITDLWKNFYPQLPVWPRTGSLTRAELQSELSSEHHVEIKYSNNSFGHVVLAYAWAPYPSGEVFFLMRDPDNNPCMMICADSVADNDKGSWTATWIILKPGEEING